MDVAAPPPSVARSISCSSAGIPEPTADAASVGATSAASRIRVAVRVRPCPATDKSIVEVAGDTAIAIRKEAATGGNQFLSSQVGRTEERCFDQVFGPDSSQDEVYEGTCQNMMSAAVVQGRSATVFVYGATGAGKTYTMFGERAESQQGMIYRAVRDVFQTLEKHDFGRTKEGSRLEVKVSFLEIYNETVRDLLQDASAPSCRVLEDERRGVVKVTNLREVPVQNSAEALQQLSAGCLARKVEATGSNSRSSRSHAVFTITVERVDPAPAGPGNPIFQRKGKEPRRMHSCISLIDLAGSERASQTCNTGAALRDGAKINQSLLALANCIDALVPKGRERSQTPRRKAPYRDSKLTLLLKASLCGHCGLVSMIANVHPGQNHFEDSNNTLEYANRASAIKHTVVVRATKEKCLQLPPRQLSPTHAVACSDAGDAASTPSGEESQRNVSEDVARASQKSNLSAFAARQPSPLPPAVCSETGPDAPQPQSEGTQLRAEAEAKPNGGNVDAGSRAGAIGKPSAGATRQLVESPDEGTSSFGSLPSTPRNNALVLQVDVVNEASQATSLPVEDPSTPCAGDARSGHVGKGVQCGRVSSERGVAPLAEVCTDQRAVATPTRSAISPRPRIPTPARRMALSPPRQRCATSPVSSPSHAPLRSVPTSPSWRAANAVSTFGNVLENKLGANGCLPRGIQGDPNIAVLLDMVETLQAEKLSLNRQLSALEKENHVLRKANLAKDRQLSCLLPKSIGGSAVVGSHFAEY
eukprot:TRINITY_DN14117_c0_g8_i1.p1 TRINITY_DN14117_c0_g8~~TRINITY_DN14117_c0_g8_i1.p1  ORF type:complete len:766 (-),score=97.94 TRINITY_DN14117_c0_g8_i1:118-2394(-)